jgi:uncharacterized protein YlxP (DUF503 family)
MGGLFTLEVKLHVGICRVMLRLPENHSLKGKRQVAHSLVAKVRNRFNVAIAEVDDNDLWQRFTLGISYVSNDGRHANEVISKVVEYIQYVRGDVEVLDYEVEMLSGL